MRDVSPLQPYRRDLGLFCLIAALTGLSLALALGQEWAGDVPHLGRLIEQPLIRAQFGMAAAGLVYGLLVLGFGGHRSDALLEAMAAMEEPERAETAKLAAAEIENQSMPLNYVAWVLPVSGFIGTVIGVSRAIGPLGQLLGENGVNQSAIGAVLSGLNIAFDTTFVGLVGVVPIMLLLMILDTSASRKVARLWARVS